MGVPSGFVDGVDDAGSQYSAGEGISISGSTINVAWDGTGSALTTSRSDHDHGSTYATLTSFSSSDGDAPNTGDNLVHWDVLTGVPSGFADGTDDGPPLADGSVTTAKLASGAVTQAKLAAAAVAASNLSQMGASTDQVLTWTGSSWAPQSPATGLLELIRVQGGVLAIPPGVGNGIDIPCPAGYGALGGAWDNDHQKIFAGRSVPSENLDEWSLDLWNLDDVTVSVTVYAICGKVGA